MMRLIFSTDCAWCFTETMGEEYCARCELLRCPYCGGISTDHIDWVLCSVCLQGLSIATRENN